MFGFEIFGPFEISNGAGNFQNAVVSAGGESELCDGILHDAFTLWAQHAVLANVARSHLGIRVDVLVEETAKLRVASGDDTVPNRLGRFGGAAARQVLVRDGRNIDLNIDAIH